MLNSLLLCCFYDFFSINWKKENQVAAATHGRHRRTKFSCLVGFEKDCCPVKLYYFAKLRYISLSLGWLIIFIPFTNNKEVLEVYTQPLSILSDLKFWTSFLLRLLLLFSTWTAYLMTDDVSIQTELFWPMNDPTWTCQNQGPHQHLFSFECPQVKLVPRTYHKEMN